jgi:hypothetical protein
MRAISFVSMCPLCGKPRRQHGYEFAELAESLTEEQSIDAYCLTCDVVWPINAEERSQVAGLIARRAGVPARAPMAHPLR